MKALLLGSLLGLVIGCAADRRVDPAELGLRDLLGISPAVAAGWDAGERGAARALIDPALADAAPDATGVMLGLGRDERERVLASLTAVDHERAAAGLPPLAIIEVRRAGDWLSIQPAPLAVEAEIELTLRGWEAGEDGGWAELPAGNQALLRALAAAAAPGRSHVVIEPAPQEPFVAAFVAETEVLLVNPVVLAAQEPEEAEEREVAGGVGVPAAPVSTRRAGGNPYSFYGSVAECAAAQRSRCEACFAGGDCDPQSDQPDGLTECEALAADDGRGYYLFCVNLSLAIATVGECVGDERPSCVQVDNAGNQLGALEVNASFIDDPDCAGGLDLCLERIYGESDPGFPPPPIDAGPGADGGGGQPQPPPPRDVSVGCGDTNANCDFSPECGGGGGAACDSPDCGGCGSSCGDGGDGGSGCGSGCDDGGGGGGGGDSCGGCGGDGGGCGGDSGGGGCGGDGGGCGGDGGGCGGDGGGCGGDGGGCGGDGGGCGGSGGGCGGSGGGDSCGGGGGGGSGSCQVARPSRFPIGLVAGLLWAFLPIPILGAWRRRERRAGGRR